MQLARDVAEYTYTTFWEILDKSAPEVFMIATMLIEDCERRKVNYKEREL